MTIDNFEVEQIDQELCQCNMSLQQGFQRYISKHRDILEHYSTQQLGGREQVPEQHVVGRFYKIMRWERLVKALLDDEDTTESRLKLTVWGSLPDKNDLWSSSVCRLVEHYMHNVGPQFLC